MFSAAYDHLSGETVAIKKINQLNSILVARRTLRELRLLRHFENHSNIIDVKDLFTSEDINEEDLEEIYIVQDLMDCDLCHIIQGKFPLSDRQCQHILFQVLKGVKVLHTANVIHRDLKPGNILWKSDGSVKICDFGLSRGVDEFNLNSESFMTNYVATRWYRPPEILLYRNSYGKPLDIWSVGCIFAELLGRKVFLPGKSGFEQLHLILQKLGSPSEETIERIPSAKSKCYLRRIPRYPTYPLSKRFPAASHAGIYSKEYNFLALDLLQRMLTFDPDERISVEAALLHPYFNDYTDPKDIDHSIKIIDFSFDNDSLSTLELRRIYLFIDVLYLIGLILEELNFYKDRSANLAVQLSLECLNINYGATIVDQERQGQNVSFGFRSDRSSSA